MQRASSGCPHGEVPFYEPGLADLVRNGVESARLSFTTSLPDAYQRSKEDRTLSAPVVMIAVGTPSGEDGSADIYGVMQVAREIGAVIDEYTVVASKSTVPVGTGDKVAQAIAASRRRPRSFDVVSNPEFLKEGAAVDDFMRPSRIIVGVRCAGREQVMLELYRPFNMNRERVMTMGPREAELTKYAANAMLATKISFINEMANLCDRHGCRHRQRPSRYRFRSAHRSRVHLPRRRLRRIVLSEGRTRADPRGAGDRRRSLRAAATHQRNEQQKHYVLDKVSRNSAPTCRLARSRVWGLSFKPGTDDVREAPALTDRARVCSKPARRCVRSIR